MENPVEFQKNVIGIQKTKWYLEQIFTSNWFKVNYIPEPLPILEMANFRVKRDLWMFFLAMADHAFRIHFFLGMKSRKRKLLIL